MQEKESRYTYYPRDNAKQYKPIKKIQTVGIRVKIKGFREEN